VLAPVQLGLLLKPLAGGFGALFGLGDQVFVPAALVGIGDVRQDFR
jgi:hypothetical protein